MKAIYEIVNLIIEGVKNFWRGLKESNPYALGLSLDNLYELAKKVVELIKDNIGLVVKLLKRFWAKVTVEILEKLIGAWSKIVDVLDWAVLLHNISFREYDCAERWDFTIVSK